MEIFKHTNYFYINMNKHKKIKNVIDVLLSIKNALFHSISDLMAVRYSRSLSDSDFANNMHPETDDTRTSLDDRHIRWQKKVIRARVMVGVLTAICCILLVILIITYESAHKDDKSCVPSLGSTSSSDSIIKFIHLADIHYDPFYNKTISRRNFCRSQGASNDTAKYIAEYGRIGCDSPKSLFENTLDAIRNVSVEQDVSFILLTGK